LLHLGVWLMTGKPRMTIQYHTRDATQLRPIAAPAIYDTGIQDEIGNQHPLEHQTN